MSRPASAPLSERSSASSGFEPTLFGAALVGAALGCIRGTEALLPGDSAAHYVFVAVGFAIVAIVIS